MAEWIASPRNPRVREVVALRDRQAREATGRIVIHGAREILRAIQGGVEVEQLFVCEAHCTSAECGEAARLAVERRIPRIDVSEPVHERIAYGDRGDGVVAVARRPDSSLQRLALPPDPLLVVLEGVEKPGNLGAVVRSADAAGADALLVADPRTDLFNPNAIRASLGTIFHVPVAAAPPGTLIPWLRERGIRIVAARVDGARIYTEVDLRGPLAIVLGSEASGLSLAWSGPGIDAVRLPMLGIADSLNVSVAAGVLLYEARRQRDAAGPHGP